MEKSKANDHGNSLFSIDVDSWFIKDLIQHCIDLIESLFLIRAPLLKERICSKRANSAL